MHCPVCKAWTRVLETRRQPDSSKRRRYECANGHRFNTREEVSKVDLQWDRKPRVSP